MKALIQRVKEARVAIKETGESRKIGPGIVIFLGVGKTDTPAHAAKLAQKIAGLRIFSNAEGKFDHSLLEVKGEALVVSQFTLYGDVAKGRRPDFTQACEPDAARPLYQEFIKNLRESGVVKIEEGEFQAKMEVNLTNDGPVTFLVEV